MYIEILEKISLLITIILDSIGVVIVITGAYRATKTLLQKKFLGEHKKSHRINLNILRLDFGYALVLALEFFLAGDIVRTIISPSWDDLGKLGALVVIRTVLSFFLNKEIKLK